MIFRTNLCNEFILKACSVVELYGFLDLDTRDWIDGLFSNIFREINRPIEKEVSEVFAI